MGVFEEERRKSSRNRERRRKAKKKKKGGRKKKSRTLDSHLRDLDERLFALELLQVEPLDLGLGGLAPFSDGGAEVALSFFLSVLFFEEGKANERERGEKNVKTRESGLFRSLFLSLSLSTKKAEKRDQTKQTKKNNLRTLPPRGRSRTAPAPPRRRTSRAASRSQTAARTSTG